MPPLIPIRLCSSLFEKGHISHHFVLEWAFLKQTTSNHTELGHMAQVFFYVADGLVLPFSGVENLKIPASCVNGFVCLMFVTRYLLAASLTYIRTSEMMLGNSDCRQQGLLSNKIMF